MKKCLLKLTLIFSFCLLTSVSYGQTKEETIEWLEDKLSKYAEDYGGRTSGKLSNFKVKAINVCEIILTYTLTFGSSKKDYQTTLPTKDLVDKNECDNLNVMVCYKNPIIKIQCFTTEETYYKRYVDHFTVSDRDRNHLPTRVKKAIKHLGTFCQKKETF